MQTDRIFAFWALCLLLIPLAAARLAGGGGRVDRIFTASCVPVAFVLLYFVPRTTLDPAVAVAATVGFSGASILAYSAFSPKARRRTVALLTVVAVVDVAALATIHFAAAVASGPVAFSLLLLAVTAATGWAAVEGVRWISSRAGVGGGIG